MENDLHKALENFKLEVYKSTKTNWFERFCLWFVSPTPHVDNDRTIIYKVFRGKVYVIDSFINPPQHWNCRCFVIPLERPN